MVWEQDLIKALEAHIAADNQPETQYDSVFFQSLQKYRPLYHFLADIIVAHLKPESAIDWGCGCGFILEKLQMHGITDLIGIEGSADVLPFIPETLKDKIIIADALLYRPKIYELAISVEVGEHIPEKDAGRFVNAVCNSASKWVWWSAAVPGQKGTDHINCQPLCIWIDIFKEVGLFEPDWELLYLLKQKMLVNHNLVLGFPWLRDNFLLFRRK